MFGVNPLGLSDLLGLCSQSGTFDQSAMGGSSSLNSILHNIAVFIIGRVQVSIKSSVNLIQEWLTFMKHLVNCHIFDHATYSSTFDS